MKSIRFQRAFCYMLVAIENRLTREQVEDIYRTNKLSLSFVPTKVDDIIEIVKYFNCTKEIDHHIAERVEEYMKILKRTISAKDFAQFEKDVRTELSLIK